MSQHVAACRSIARLQLCKLLKLKPLCLLPLPGAPKHLVKGEYGSKSAWQVGAMLCNNGFCTGKTKTIILYI